MLGNDTGEINEILTLKRQRSRGFCRRGALQGPRRSNLLFRQIGVIDVLTAALSRTWMQPSKAAATGRVHARI
jgi:hypothetical protein